MSDTAEQVAALRKRRTQATNVDGVNVDFALLDALLEAWDNWQMVEAMPRYRALEHDYCWGKDTWWVENSHMGEGSPARNNPADALAAAREESTDGD